MPDESDYSGQPARFSRNPLSLPSRASRSESQSPFRLQMPSISPSQLAFSALQYLPVPTLVLNNLKTVVLANDAMGRLLALPSDELSQHNWPTAADKLRGQTLSQVGIDMLQDGRPVWVTWDNFLDTLVREMGVRPRASEQQPQAPSGREATSTASVAPELENGDASTPGNLTQDSTVEVVITRKDMNQATFDPRCKSKQFEYQILAKMIITIWEVDEKQTYFTLTFTNTQSSSSSIAATKRPVAHQGTLEAADRKSIFNSQPSSLVSSRDSNAPSLHSPGVITMSSSPFPPLGPPSIASQSRTPSMLQKIIIMKDALLDNTQMPILAMWKDGSVACPNKAARNFLVSGVSGLDTSVDGVDLLNHWQLWDEEFTRQLDVNEYPISILLKTETPFESMRIGMYDSDGDKVILDVLGEAIRDELSGEFLAGVVTGRDVTAMSHEITQIKERDEERFRLICDTMPQLVWTATPEGYHDFFNTRWYDYTGFTHESSQGDGWQNAFHPDDMPETLAAWNKCLHTGEPFVTEYRCRSSEGKWNWFLGRALAVRNKDSGEIEKWFGTCTDVNSGIETKRIAQQTREQLLSVIAHSHVTVFMVDRKRCVTMLEGALIWKSTSRDDTPHKSRWFIGENVYTVFNRLVEQISDGEKPDFLEPLEDILEGRKSDDVQEHGLDNRWYRTRFLPMSDSVRQTFDGAERNDTLPNNVIGLIMDVTELRDREQALQVQAEERRKAIANEAAAKEATRLKSQFLANMSHEIRTPITGVLGMAELLGGMELDEEQRDYVDNIQSSATSLLTVINDILDFSKVESGRLDIEEVQFSLSVIVKEVVRMLRFAVERKNLAFKSDIGDEIENDMVVIGDPGRVRQIITNLLTNSIKFTHQGYVRFSAVKAKDTPDSVEIKFVVEDTGIGIEDEVRRKLFKPFSQGDASTARRFGGTGLGLTICKNLLDLMHGGLQLESTVGNGTKAMFWIPFHKPQGTGEVKLAQPGAISDRLQSELSISCNSSEYEQVPGVSAVSEGGNSAGLPVRRNSIRTPPLLEQDMPRADRANVHILVVEDNPVNQKIATKSIIRLGFQVAATWNGKEALDYLMDVSKGVHPKPDIILMDVQMPVIDGYKCTHMLRHHLPYKTIVRDVPIVAMTASAIQGDREKCNKAGMDDYLSKPVMMSMLEKMLVRWSLTKRRERRTPMPSVSDCSEISAQCETADIPHVGLQDDDVDSYNSPITPRPLTTNGQPEPSPFDSPSAAAQLTQQARAPEGEKEWSNRLQDTKLIDAAGGRPNFRSGSFRESEAGHSLTEENMNKLKNENLQPTS